MALGLRDTTWCGFALLGLTGCTIVNDSSESFGDGAADTESAGDGVAGDDLQSSGGQVELPEPDGDFNYPSPTPLASTGLCPAGTFGPLTFDGTTLVCLPECGEADFCPAGQTGTASGLCAVNPFSSAFACTRDSDCSNAAESCGNAGDRLGCLLPPSHCILRCDVEGQVCPDEMTCASGICAYR